MRMHVTPANGWEIAEGLDSGAKHVGPTIRADADKNLGANGQPGLARQLGIADVGVLGQALLFAGGRYVQPCVRVREIVFSL